MSAHDPRKHITMCSADEDMRKLHQSVIHHVYYKHSEQKKEGEYESFSACSGPKGEKMSADGLVTKASVKNASRRWTNTLFSEGTPNSMPVAYSFIMQSYYIRLGNWKIRKVPLIEDPVIGRYYFMHPQLKRKTWAQFPMGVLTPTDARY